MSKENEVLLMVVSLLIPHIVTHIHLCEFELIIYIRTDIGAYVNSENPIYVWSTKYSETNYCKHS